MAEDGESLARLVEIADAVSRQQAAAALAMSVQVVARPNPFEAVVSAALLKRAMDNHHLAAEAARDAKRSKMEDVPENGVHFLEYQAEIWSEKFEDLCEFRKYYGHCHVPHTYARNAPLAQWVKRQRYQYKLKIEGKRSTLSDERVRLLHNIGFIWNSHEAVWEERRDELLQYKRSHGHCVVPSNFDRNPQLAVWVKRQRRQYKFYCEKKATSMTPERITKLEKLGFAWDCRKNKGEDDTTEDSRPATPPSPQPANQSAPSTASEKSGQSPSNALTSLAKPTATAKSYPQCEFFSFSRTF
jgi:hypothetical protein